MGAKKGASRCYTMSDDDMLTESKTKAQLAKVDYPALAAVEPNLTLEEIQQWDADIDSCLDDFSSLNSKSAITIATQNVLDVMATCRDEVQDFYFHCERALPEVSTIAIEFGRKGFDKSRKNPERMMSLLNMIITGYDKPEYKPKLEQRFPKNYKEMLIGLKQRLNEAFVAQNLAKANQPAETESRILKYNAVWMFTRNISEIAKVAFRDSYAKQQQYKLYDTTTLRTDNSGGTDNPEPPTKE